MNNRISLLIILFLYLPTICFADPWNWGQKYYSVNQEVTTLQCLDSNICYAFLSDNDIDKNIIMRSDNQGEDWYEIYSRSIFEGDSIMYISKCYVVDTNNIYMTYNRRQFLIDKSTDGGKTFKRTIFEDNGRKFHGYIHNILMYDQNIGIIIFSYDCFITTDSWETYTVLELNEYDTVGPPMFFLDSANVVINKIFTRSTSYLLFNLETHEWSTYYDSPEIPEGGNDLMMYYVCFMNDSTGFACGGQETGSGTASSDIIWKTTDKGKSWVRVFDNLKPHTFACTRIACSGNHIAAIGNWDKVIESTDAGDSWHYVDSPELYDITARVAVAGQYIIASVLGSGIWRYEDPSAVYDMPAGPDIRLWSSRGRLHIDCPSSGFSQNHISISDISGRVVHEQSISSESTIIDISSFAKAVYLYSISSGNRLLKSGSFVVGE